MLRKTHRSVSRNRRATRRRTHGGRGGMGGADLGHAFTTGASQTLYQMNGRTPGLSSGGGKGKKNLTSRQSGKAAKLKAHAHKLLHKAEILEKKANIMENKANILENKANAIMSNLRANAPEFIPSNNYNMYLNNMGEIIIPANKHYKLTGLRRK